MDEYKFDLAQRFCERALEMDNDNVKALELTSSLLLEMGQVESAQHCLGRAIHVEPHAGYSKYLSLAQLMTGVESRDCYRKGVEIISTQLSSDNSGDELKAGELRRDLSNAYVSIAELYMTDLCDEPEAETESRRCIDLSIESDPSNPESLQARANYALVTGNIEEAKSSISQSLALWLPQHLKFLEDNEGTETHLSYTFRLSTAKILLDLEDYDNSTKVLESLTEEDDEVVSTWYLLGWSNYLRSKEEEGYLGNARFYLSKALKVNKKSPTDDKDMLAHIEELVEEIGEDKDEESTVEDEQRLVEAEPEAVAALLDGEAAGAEDTMEMES